MADPALEAVLADSVGLALFAVLETLTPAERLAFVLHDTFGGPVRGDRADRRPVTGCHAPARKPCAPARPRRCTELGCRSAAPARDRRRLPSRLACR